MSCYEITCVNRFFDTLFSLTACVVLPFFNCLVFLAAAVIVVDNLYLASHCCKTSCIIFSARGLDFLKTIGKVGAIDLMWHGERKTGFNEQGFKRRKRDCFLNLQLELLRLFCVKVSIQHSKRITSYQAY